LSDFLIYAQLRYNNPNDMSKENSIFIVEGVVFQGSIKAPNECRD